VTNAFLHRIADVNFVVDKASVKDYVCDDDDDDGDVMTVP
jgi:hypothetical protein